MRPNKETACANIWKRVINTLVEQILKTPVVDTAYEGIVKLIESLTCLWIHYFICTVNFRSKYGTRTAAIIPFQLFNVYGKENCPINHCSRHCKSGKIEKLTHRWSSVFLHFKTVTVFWSYHETFVWSTVVPFRTGILFKVWENYLCILRSRIIVIFFLFKVQWNILGGGLHGSHIMKMMKNDETKCPWATLEDNYRQYVGIESSVKPLFYNLSTPDFNCQEIPKLDGLVSNHNINTFALVRLNFCSRFLYYFLFLPSKGCEFFAG